MTLFYFHPYRGRQETKCRHLSTMYDKHRRRSSLSTNTRPGGSPITPLSLFGLSVAESFSQRNPTMTSQLQMFQTAVSIAGDPRRFPANDNENKQIACWSTGHQLLQVCASQALGQLSGCHSTADRILSESPTHSLIRIQRSRGSRRPQEGGWGWSTSARMRE